MKAKIKGYWFYGYSGVGKTFTSKYLNKRILNSVIIDGDDVRKLISVDLKYTLRDREIQMFRLLGICKLIINNNLFPIVSASSLNKNFLNYLIKNKIAVYNIKRNMNDAIKNNATYKNKKNVMGIDLKMPKLKTKIIYNTGNKKFYSELRKLIF